MNTHLIPTQDITLETDIEGSGEWTIIHPTLGTLYHLELVADQRADAIFLTLTCLRNDRIIEQDTLSTEGLL